jgi:hypothetical protein
MIHDILAQLPEAVLHESRTRRDKNETVERHFDSLATTGEFNFSHPPGIDSSIGLLVEETVVSQAVAFLQVLVGCICDGH